MPIVQIAQPEDYTPWLKLAGEVEDLFGPMVEVPEFQQTLMKNILRQTALCVREENGPPGSALLGGLFFSPKPPIYKISWLVVSQSCQRQGVGQRLVAAFLERVQPPAELMVTTFSQGVPGGEAARRFYVKLGFHPAEIVYHDYRGEMEAYQVFQRSWVEEDRERII
jgi:GNAT superfamily N-acetyltransferase